MNNEDGEVVQRLDEIHAELVQANKSTDNLQEVMAKLSESYDSLAKSLLILSDALIQFTSIAASRLEGK